MVVFVVDRSFYFSDLILWILLCEIDLGVWNPIGDSCSFNWYKSRFTGVWTRILTVVSGPFCLGFTFSHSH
jgi:hypothetical protein